MQLAMGERMHRGNFERIRFCPFEYRRDDPGQPAPSFLAQNWPDFVRFLG